GRLAAELERYALEISRSSALDYATDFGRAGERDLVHVAVLGDGRTGGRSEAGDDVDDAGRHVGFEQQLGKTKRRKGRLLRGLEHAGVAACKSRRKFPRSHQQRKIPRDDLSADAVRLAQRVREKRIADRNRLAEDLVGPAAVVREDFGSLRDVDVSRLGDRLSVVERLELRELVLVLH